MPEQPAAQASAEKLAAHLAVQDSAEKLDEHFAAHLAEYLAGRKANRQTVDHMPVCSAPADRMLVVRKLAATAGRQYAVSADAVLAFGERLTRSTDVAAPHSAKTPAYRCSQAARTVDCILFAPASAMRDCHGGVI